MTDTELCPKCQTDHDGYPAGSLGAETWCLRSQAALIGAGHLVDQVDALSRDAAERRDEALRNDGLIEDGLRAEGTHHE